MFDPWDFEYGSSSSRQLRPGFNRRGTAGSRRPYRPRFGTTSTSGRQARSSLISQLPEYEVPPSIRVLYESKFKRTGSYGPEEDELLEEVTRAKQGLPLTKDNYKQRLLVLNQIEDEHLHREYRKCTIQDPRITERPDLVDPKIGGHMYQLSVSQLKNSSLIKEDTGVRFSIEGSDRKVSGTVHEKDRTFLTIFSEKAVPCSSVHKMDFLAERTPFQMEYHALSLLHDDLIEKILFPECITGKESVYDVLYGLSEERSEFDWFSPSVATNHEQAQAIRNIFHQTSFPAPYVLFGPPGTGKTSTLVEAIGQIFKLKPQAKVLAVATSNSAADELTSRLLKIIPEEEIFRYFAKSMARKKNDIEQDVLDASNLNGWHYGMENKDFYERIRPCRIVTCTLTTAGRLVFANIPKEYFSYIFVDECGSAKEISCLIPIIGMGTIDDRVTASVVLAGDPKQLGPVIQFEFLNPTSHSVSLLERITSHSIYRKGTLTGEYNPKVITQLKDNFRSHPAILDLPNRMFYEGVLRAMAPRNKVYWAVGWYKLLNSNFPFVFHSIAGETLQDKNSSSMYNVEEAEMVVSYVSDMLTNGINGKSIEQGEIGIITPYACQVKYLKKLFKKRNWDEIEIGSTEQYQGREKPVMLMSTVRSGGKSVGFLANTKRMNVSITRAQALMIIMGNSNTLEQNEHWKALIDYCRDNRALKNELPINPNAFKFTVRTSNRSKKTEKSKSAPKSGSWRSQLVVQEEDDSKSTSWRSQVTVPEEDNLNRFMSQLTVDDFLSDESSD